MAEYSNEINAALAAKDAEIERLQRERTAERAQHQQRINELNQMVAQLDSRVVNLKALLYDYITELGYSLEGGEHGSSH